MVVETVILDRNDRLRQIAQQTRTTKANVATALQMISWGLEVNDYGNARLDSDGQFVKVPRGCRGDVGPDAGVCRCPGLESGRL